MEHNLRTSMGSQTLPHAKIIPKIAAAGSDLLDGKSNVAQDWIQSIAALPRVKELCGSVYSCGPPPAYIGQI